LEELAQEVLMDEDLNETTSQPRTEHQTEKSSTEDTTSSSSVKQSHEPESKDSAAVAEEALSKVQGGASSAQVDPKMSL
jgi:hypothetical protein